MAVRNVQLRQGVLGLKVKVMASNKIKVGALEKVMPDFVQIDEPKDTGTENVEPHVISTQKEDQGAQGTPQQ